MSLVRPTVQQERWLAVAHRYPALHDAAEARAGGWKRPGFWSRLLMFALGLLAASMITGSLLWLPGRWLVAGVAMVAAGEWLIRSRRLVAGGIEEALIACGLVAIAGQGLDWVDADDSLAVFLFCAALLVAGLRVGNALFTTLAAVGVSLAIALIGDRDLFDSGMRSFLSLSWCVAVTLGAVVLGARPWQRPSCDRMLDGLVIAMPLAAFGWALADAPAARGIPLVAVGIALVFAALLLIIGLRRRDHAPLLGALMQLACLAYALRELSGLPLHGRLLLWGGLLLAAGFAIDRGLRRPRGGLTSAPLGPRSSLDDLVQVYGASLAAPVHAPPSSGGFEGQGGGFAGGGASGRY